MTSETTTLIWSSLRWLIIHHLERQNKEYQKVKPGLVTRKPEMATSIDRQKILQICTDFYKSLYSDLYKNYNSGS